MIRRDDWQTRLNDYLHAVQRRAHRYGDHDCALFVAGAIQAMTGEDPAADVRGEYADAEAADALLEAAHGGTLEGACRDRLGEPIAPLQAMTGDVVIGPWGRDPKGSDVVGIVIGSRVATVSSRGQTRKWLRAARLAWRI